MKENKPAGEEFDESNKLPDLSPLIFPPKAKAIWFLPPMPISMGDRIVAVVR